jgi:hypothetical protein
MKSVPFKMPAARPVDQADAWVQTREAPEEQAEPMKRFTIDVPTSLHRRIKTRCAERGEKMADVIRALLERDFPS